MLETISNKIEGRNTSDKFSTFRDEILSEYYVQYFNSLTSKEFDKEFNRDLSALVKSLNKLPQEDRNALIGALSKLIEFYVENKVEKELDHSFKRIFKFL